MRTIIFYLSLFCSLSSFAGSASEQMVAGDWSQVTNGLRGRILLGEDAKSEHGMRRGIVYLELQNVLWGDALYVYYNATSINFEMRDSNQKPVRNWISGSDSIPAPCWLTLPLDSTLRFRTGSSAYEPDEPGLFITAGYTIGADWFIPSGATNDYYLSGTFTSTAPTGESRPRVWQGTLKLPPLKIPAATGGSARAGVPKAP